MRVAIVGCGLIGRKRAAALGAHPLVACADLSLGLAERLAAGHPGCVATDDFGRRRRARRGRRDRGDDEQRAAPAALAAVEAASTCWWRSGREMRRRAPPAAGRRRAARRVVKVGFNHRFHPAFQKAREIFDAGEIGSCSTSGAVRPRRPARLRPRVAPTPDRGRRRAARPGRPPDRPGALVLRRLHGGRGHVATYYWQMPVEDNGFALLKTADGQVAWLHASCTEWKNLFSFEIFGRWASSRSTGSAGATVPSG